MLELNEEVVLAALLKAIKEGAEEFTGENGHKSPTADTLIKDAVSDSLERVEITMDVEDALGIEITIELDEKLDKTIRQVAQEILAAA